MPRKIAIVTGFAAVLLIAVMLAQPAKPAPAPPAACGRECLNGIMDQYLAAVVAHDPSKAPLAKNIKFTEDGVRLQPGDGLWATASGLGDYKLYFDEPGAGAAGIYALIQENGATALLNVRLKIAAGKITEAETLVARKQTTGILNTDNLKEVHPLFLESVPAADQPSRAEMVAIVGKYFDGIEQGNGDIVPFDKDVVRIENGIQTCPGSATSRLGALSCGQQLSTKIFTYIQSVNPRRFPIVDRERGLVLALVRFNHPATAQSIDVPGRGKMSMGNFSQWPNSTQIAELFKIKDRKIREITAVIVTQPYKMPNGWE